MIDNKISIKGDPVTDILRGAIGHRTNLDRFNIYQGQKQERHKK